MDNTEDLNGRSDSPQVNFDGLDLIEGLSYSERKNIRAKIAQNILDF